MRTELELAWAGLRHRPGPWLLLALGIAVAALMPVTAAGLQTGAAASAVRDAVAEVPEPSRGVLAVTSRDVRGAALTTLSAYVRSGFVDAGLPEPQQALAFRTVALDGTDATVAALDRLGDDVALTSGRLPRQCSPTACEVLAVSTPGGTSPTAAARAAGTLGLVVTGVAELREPRLAGLGLVIAGQPLLLGADPAAMGELESLDLFGRNLAWFSALDGAVVAARGTDAFTRALADVAAEVDPGVGPLTVSWPSDVVLAAAGRAGASAARFTVLGAGAGALQLAFCLVVAAGRRRSQQQYGVLLGRRGAGRRQVLQVATGQPVIAVLAGLVVGTGLGALGVVGLARGVVDRPWVAAGSAVAATAPTLLALALTAVLATVAVTRWRPVTTRAVRLLLGLVLAASLGLVVLALVRPGTDLGAPLPTAALVALVLAVGLVAGLAWAPAVAGLDRLGRRRRSALRPWVLLIRRRPLLPGVTAGFLAAALATAVLAGAYGATLARSAQDRAAATVPLDVRVTSSSQVPIPSTVVDSAALRALSPDVVVGDVVSTPVTAFAGSSFATSLPLTGLDPTLLPRVHAFAAVTGADVGAAELADRLAAAPPTVAAPVVPAGTTRLALDVSGLGDDVTLALWYAGADGQEKNQALARSGNTATATFGPGTARTVRALEVVESAQHATGRQHAIGEGRTDRPLPTGTLRLGSATAGGAPLAWSWAGWGSDQAEVSTTGGTLQVRYQLTDRRMVLVPSWTAPSVRTPLPVAVDPDTAARAGSRAAFGVTLNGTAQPVRVVAVLPRMPTLPRTFVLADAAAVSALVDRVAPGTAPVTQVWIGAPGTLVDAVRARLESSTATAATLRYRGELAVTLASDPVAGGFIRLLGLAGAVALLLAAVAAAGGVRSDRDASAADLYALELDGVGVRRLRRALLARGALVVAVGVPVGLLGGVGAAAAAVRLLATGPDGVAVEPPLRLVLASAPTAAVLVLAVLGVTGAVVASAAGVLREARADAPEGDLR